MLYFRQMKSKNVTRRKGIFGFLHNLLFDPEKHSYFIFDLQLLPHLLQPIVTGTPFTEEERIGMDESLQQVHCH